MKVVMVLSHHPAERRSFSTLHGFLVGILDLATQQGTHRSESLRVCVEFSVPFWKAFAKQSWVRLGPYKKA